MRSDLKYAKVRVELVGCGCYTTKVKSQEKSENLRILTVGSGGSCAVGKKKFCGPDGRQSRVSAAPAPPKKQRWVHCRRLIDNQHGLGTIQSSPSSTRFVALKQRPHGPAISPIHATHAEVTMT